MATVTTLHAYSARPNSTRLPTGEDVPIFEFVLMTGEHLAVVLSGEGMVQLAKDIGEFLRLNPALAQTKSLRPQ